MASFLLLLLHVRSVLLREAQANDVAHGVLHALFTCRYVDAILGVAELKRQLSVWTERYQGEHHHSGSMGSGAQAREVQAKRKESGSGEWSFFSSIIKALTGGPADDEYADDSRRDAPLSPLSLHVQRLPRTMAAARWMWEYADHLAAKLELCTEHIRARIRRCTPAIDPATLTANRFTRSVEDALRRTGTCFCCMVHGTFCRMCRILSMHAFSGWELSLSDQRRAPSR